MSVSASSQACAAVVAVVLSSAFAHQGFAQGQPPVGDFATEAEIPPAEVRTIYGCGIAHVSARTDGGDDWAAIIVGTFADKNNKRWRMTPAGGGHYRFQQITTGRFLDAHETAQTGFRVVTRPLQGDNTQLWHVDSPIGPTSIRQKSSNRLLSCDRAHPGGPFVLKVLRPGDVFDTSQQWNLEVASAPPPSAGRKTILGGVNLQAYCQRTHGAQARAVELDRVNAHWNCGVPISVLDACKMHYGQGIRAELADTPAGHKTWQCVKVTSGTRTVLGGVNLKAYCQRTHGEQARAIELDRVSAHWNCGVPISVLHACKMHYGQDRSIRAELVDAPGGHKTWQCVRLNAVRDHRT